MTDLVRVSGLSVVASDRQGNETTIVDNVSFSIPKGEVLALIGESGSGKTTIALSLLGYARGGCRISSGSVYIGDTDLMTLSREQLSGVRGRQVTYVAQSAAASFNPSKTIMNQVVEVALIHGLMGRSEAETKAIGLFHDLGLPDPDSIGDRYPHQVSGGQLQRLMAAMALITDPELVIFDEPTTSLDVTTQIDTLRVFKKAIKSSGSTAVYVSHDLAVVVQMADQILVLNQGAVRESGSTEQILNAPEDAYTQSLMAAARSTERKSDEREDEDVLLAVHGLAAGYGKIDRNGVPAIPVLKDIDLTIRRGATLGVIGESGSGKSTLARVIAGLIAPAQGSITLGGEELPPTIKDRTLDQFRRVQIVFQHADTALNPAHTVAHILGRPLRLYFGMRGAACEQRVAELLSLVHLPANMATRRCGGLSGGQKQRINLARALAAEPDLILCDEVTSALDTVVAAVILDLLAELRKDLGLSYMFISHDISTVRSLCDDIVVLYAGNKVEQGTRQNFRAPPFHPYTDLLIASVPELQRGWLERVGEMPDLPVIGAIADSSGLCRFLDRCPVRIDGVCNTTPPPHVDMGSGDEVLCHHSLVELQQLHVVASRETGGLR